MNKYSFWLSRAVVGIWLCNCIIGGIIAVKQVWIPYMNAGQDAYEKIISDPFNGTTMPIAYIPDWTKTEYQDKSKRFEDIPISDYLPIPLYDTVALSNTVTQTKASTLLHYTYFTPYMGSYRLNYKEYDGSHLAVDIRAPLGTPVLSVANGVVVRINEKDPTGNKYVVIRHDGILWNGEKKTFYSSYLHLSEILVTEGTKISKGDVLGRVGMTGIATTPHLHFQVDTSDAPFHPYWPFTSSESQKAGLSFFDSINTGLGKDKAAIYTIHPMNFVNMYLGGTENINFNSAPIVTIPEVSGSAQISEGSQSEVASFITSTPETCEKKRFRDVSERSSLGKMLYPLIDNKCIFQESDTLFSSKTSVTQREAIITLMKYYDIAPANGTSHFLDIAIGDSFQGYALVAYRRGLLDGNYAHPEKILTKGDFIHLLTKIANVPKNPSNIRIYNDVDSMSLYYQSAQDYAYMTKSRGGKLYVNTLLNRGMMTQILAGIRQKK